MKKTLYILFAAAIAIATVACSKEELFNSNGKQPQLRTITCSFDEGDATKTDITQKGKTVWSEGDKIWVSNGTAFDTLTVDKAYAGQKYCEFKTALEGTLYVVYPFSAAQGVTDGKFQIDVPQIQNGIFGAANICVAVATDRYVKMKNVTSVLKFDIPDTTPILAVSINAADNPVAGTCSVDMTSGTPVVTPLETASSMVVKTAGLTGKFYATVIPGTYNAGFTMTAVSNDLKHASQTRSTVSAKELKANDLFNLGTIGDDLKPLNGDGSSSAPWEISSFPQFLAFAYYVADGNTMAGQYAKVTNDISGITSSIGTYDDANKVYAPFKGNFDGNGKTLTLSMKQLGMNASGLFANVADSAYIHDVKVAGTLTSNYSFVGGLIGVMYTEKTSATVDNCTSTATVKGASKVGGLIGYSVGNSLKTIKNCTNEGTVTAETTAAGVCGYSYHSDLYKDVNKGTVTTTADNGGVYIGTNAGGGKFTDGNWVNGTGGVVGWAQNSTVLTCSNSGDVTAVNKIGGVVGSAYYSEINYANNTGKVSCTTGVMGGVVGWILTYGNLFNSSNSGVVDGADKSGWVGGVLGYASPQAYKPYPITIARCTNTGKVSATGSGVGGVVGYSYSMMLAYGGKTYGNRTMIYDCTNEGDVTSTGDYVGGIYGFTKDWWSWTVPVISGCANKGNITGNNYVSGIVGYIEAYSSGVIFMIDNCENHGNILTTRTDDAGEFAGGIVGAFTKGCNSGRGVRLRNCLNDGNIQYSDASHVKVNMGGIAGYFSSKQNSYNCFNGGTVGPVSGTIASGAEATLGALIGNCAATLNYSYYLVTTCANPVGTSSGVKAGATIISSDASGNMATSISINSVAYSTVVEALNANATGLYGWKWNSKPVFVYPSYTGPINGGDFDLGNGGQL